jgi:hypothetical protein
MKITFGFIKTFTVASLGILLGLLPVQRAAAAINLGTAGPGDWALLDIGSGSVTVENVSLSGNSAVNGNAGISSPDILTMSGGSFINGDLYLGNTASTNFSGGSGVNGTTFTNQDPKLTQARTDALAAAAFYAGLGGTPTTIDTNSGNLTLTPGTYALSSFSLGGSQTLTLNGAGDFVFNISGLFSLAGSSQIILAGGATDADVLYNITGTTSTNQSGTSIIHGIILAPNASVVVDGGVGAPPHVGVFGEVISGGNAAGVAVDIHSGSAIQGIPEPSVFALITGVGGLGVIGRAIFRRRRV